MVVISVEVSEEPDDFPVGRYPSGAAVVDGAFPGNDQRRQESAVSGFLLETQ